MRYTLRSEDGAKKWNNDKPKSIEEENVRIYLEDMQKKDPRDMKSKIASDAVNEYKGDPYIMDKTRKWAEETYKDQLKDEKNKWNESQKKKMEAQKKKYEGKLVNQRIQFAESLLSSEKMSVSEIANMTKLTEEEVEKIKRRMEK